MNVKSCWEKTATLVFNNLNTKRLPYRKPEQLPLGVSFLRTEARVILAFLLITVRCNNFNISEYVEIRKQGNFVICHLKQPNRILHLTKDEIDRMLEGWPPFYRSSFESPEGYILQSPITSYEHLKRPGWIVAIGIGRLQPADICTNPDVFKIASNRVEETLKGAFLDAWPGDPTIIKAIDTMQAMQEKGSAAYPSGYERQPVSSTNTIKYPSEVLHLTKEQCIAAMQVFHNMGINEDQKRILEPSLREVLLRVCVGLAAVLDYTDCHERKLVVPELLQGDKIVYLRDCYVDEEEQ